MHHRSALACAIALVSSVAVVQLAVPQAAEAASARPVVSSLSTHSGTVAGGTKVTITGQHFVPRRTSVYFGTTKGRSTTVASSTKLTVTAPRHSGGVQHVQVRTSHGRSSAHRADRYRFVVSPVSKLHVVRTTTSAVRLGWRNPSTTTYSSLKVRRGATVLATLKRGATRFVDTNLREDTRYSYSVTAYYGSAAGSTARKISTTTANIAPGGVRRLAATPDGPVVQLRWANPSDHDLAGIKICRATGRGRPRPVCHAITGVGPKAVGYTDSGLSSGTYTYAVFPFDDRGALGPASYITLAVTVTTGATPVREPDPTTTVTADALPTVQIGGGSKNSPVTADAVAWTQVVVGNTVYVGGDFSSARPAGVAFGGPGQVARHNVLAFDITTGALLTSFGDPKVNGQVLAVAASPDGKRIYIGGDFTRVGGASHRHIAALDATTGKVIPSFAAATGDQVRALVATKAGVYAGGNFRTAGTQTRARLASFTTAGRLTSWAPTALGTVRALLRVGDKIVVGGSFVELNGATAYGIGAVSAAGRGARLPWLTDKVVRDYGKKSGITSLTTDGIRIYGNGFDYTGSGNLEGTYASSLSDGRVLWVESCHGDSYGNFVNQGIVYTVSHAHSCLNLGAFPNVNGRNKRTMAFTANATGTLLPEGKPSRYYNFGGTPSPSIIDWFPSLSGGTYTGQEQAAWSIVGNSTYVVEAGEFPKVNGKSQFGIVRFATRSAPGNTPSLSAQNVYKTWTPQRDILAGTISIPENWDADGLHLTYELLRQTGTDQYDVMDTQDAASTFWQLGTVTFTAGSAIGSGKYRVRVTDQDGVQTLSPFITVS